MASKKKSIDPANAKSGTKSKSTSSATRSVDGSQSDDLHDVLRTRFEANMQRHRGVAWSDVLARVEGNAKALKALAAMERTGGEPDVVCLDPRSTEWCFVDCSPETPEGRRSLCYDREARTSRKEHAPSNSALEMAAELGIELLSVEQYRALQDLGEFDLKTSSWLATPHSIRALGGALFGDRRYDTVFTYHNGAQSYYAVRGFRGLLRV